MRDAVKAASRELAGDPDAGIRLEIPVSLQPNLKALEAVSYQLKQKHPALKRNIRFNDNKMDLILHFSVDPTAGKPWRKLKPAQAKELKKEMGTREGEAQDVTEEEMDDLLAGHGPNGAGP